MLNLKLDHCVIHVSNWERSNAFYRDVFGAELIRQGTGWAYRFGDTQLNCHGPGVEPIPWPDCRCNPAIAISVSNGPVPRRRRYCHLRMHDVAVELGPVARNATRGEGTSVYFRDPDGSLLELISYTDRGK